MADKTVVVRYIARGASQVGAQALAVAKSHTRAASQMARASDQVAARSRAIAGVAAFAGKAVLLGIGAAFAVSAKAAIDFESSMAGVFKTLGDTASSAEITALGDALRAMSLVVPTNIKDLTKIAELGGQLGVGVGDMESFVETIAALDVSTNLNFDDAAKGLARFSNILQLPIADVDKLGNVIVDLGNNLATTESEILTFALRLAPIGKTIGATEEQILGISAAFSSLGIPAERGATALQRSFLDIERAVDSGGPKLLKYAQAAGMTVEEFKGLDAIGRFTAFTEGLRRIQDEGGSALTTLRNLKINQQRTIQVLLAAAGAGDLLSLSLERANVAGENGNAMWEEAARRYGTTESQIGLVVNAFNDLRIELGAGLIPFIQSMMSWLKDLFMSMKNNAGTIKTFSKALLLVVGMKGLLGLLTMVGKATTALATMKNMWGVSMLMGGGFTRQIGWMSTALGGLAGALGIAVGAYVAYTAWQAKVARDIRIMQERVDALNDSLSSGTNPVEAWGNAIKNSLTPNAIDGIHNAGISINDLAESLAGMPGSKPLEELVNVFGNAEKSGALGWFQDLSDVLKGNQFSDTFNSLSDAVKGNAETWQDWVAAVGTDVATKAVLDRQRAANDLADILKFEVAVGVNYEQQKTEALLDGTAERERIQNEAISEFKTLQQEASELGRTISFLDTVYGGSDESIKAWEDYVSDTDDILDDFTTSVRDAFTEVRSSISDGIGIWDEYSGAVDLNLTKAMKSMKLRLVDAAAWNQTIKTLLDAGVSGDTITLFEQYALSDKAALTLMLKENPELLFQYIDSFESGIAEFGTIAAENLDIRGIVKQRMDETIQEIAGAALLLNEAGVDAFGAFIQATSDKMSEMTPAARNMMLDAIIEMGDSGVLADMFGLGQDLIDALVRGLLSKRSILNGALGGLGDGLIRTANDKFEIGSPSKIFMDMGENITKGLMIGMERGSRSDFSQFENFIGNFRQAAFGPGQGGISNTSNDNRTQSTTVLIQDSQHRDLRSDISSGLIAGGVNRQVEVLVKK